MALLDELKARHEQLRNQDRYLDYEVPGWRGQLVIRFNIAPYEVVAAYQTTFDTAELLNLDADAIVKSCREILGRDDGELKPLVPGEKTTFATVADVLEYEADTAREAVLGLFPTDLAVGEAANRLVLWSRVGDAQLDEDLAGKSDGGRSSSGPPADNTSD